MTSTPGGDLRTPPDPDGPQPASPVVVGRGRLGAVARRVTVVLLTLAALGLTAWGVGGLVADPNGRGRAPLPAATGRPLSPWRHVPDRSPGDTDRPADSARPDVLFDGPLTVHAGTGVDLDRIEDESPALAGSDTALDIGWELGVGLSAGHSDLYLDQGMPQDAAARCAAMLAQARDGSPALQVFPGDQLCLSTSEGRTAWLRVGQGSAAEDELTVQVTVWESSLS